MGRALTTSANDAKCWRRDISRNHLLVRDLACSFYLDSETHNGLDILWTSQLYTFPKNPPRHRLSGLQSWLQALKAKHSVAWNIATSSKLDHNFQVLYKHHNLTPSSENFLNKCFYLIILKLSADFIYYSIYFGNRSIPTSSMSGM